MLRGAAAIRRFAVPAASLGSITKTEVTPSRHPVVIIHKTIDVSVCRGLVMFIPFIRGSSMANFRSTASHDGQDTPP